MQADYKPYWRMWKDGTNFVADYMRNCSGKAAKIGSPAKPCVYPKIIDSLYGKKSMSVTPPNNSLLHKGEHCTSTPHDDNQPFMS